MARLIAQLNTHLLVVGSLVLGGNVRVGMAAGIIPFGVAVIAFESALIFMHQQRANGPSNTNIFTQVHLYSTTIPETVSTTCFVYGISYFHLLPCQVTEQWILKVRSIVA